MAFEKRICEVSNSENAKRFRVSWGAGYLVVRYTSRSNIIGVMEDLGKP